MTTRERKSAVAGARARHQTAVQWIERLTRARSEMLRTMSADEREFDRHAPLYKQLQSGTGFDSAMRWHHPPAVAHLLQGWSGEGIDTWTARRDEEALRAEALAVGLPTEEQTAEARRRIAGIEADLGRLDTNGEERYRAFEETLAEALQLAVEVVDVRAEQDRLIDRGARLADDFDLSCRRQPFDIPGKSAKLMLTSLLAVVQAGPNERGAAILKHLERLRAEHNSRPWSPTETTGKAAAAATM